MPPMERSMVKAAPPWLRSRLLLRFAQGLVRSSYSGSRAISKMKGGTARVDLRASVFCTVRDRVPHPLCGFYTAAFTRLMALFDIGATIEVVACRGTGETSCVFNVSLLNGQREPAAVEAL
jgi:predicted hydrocarbon binding protein